MDIVRLPFGQPAPLETDCLWIEEQDDASYRLTASALCTGDDDDTSVTLVEMHSFVSFFDAESTGMAWADDIGVARLFISVGTLATPPRPTEADLPLRGA